MSEAWPDFHISHAEKIEWMIDTKGWAIQAQPPDADADPPVPAVAHTVGLPALVEFPEIVVFGLTPVAATGLLELVVDALRGGTEIAVGVELVGLLDNDLRCMFAPLAADAVERWLGTALAWHRGASIAAVQLLYPDRNGFMPYELGFDQRMRFAQPVVGAVDA